MGCLPPVAAQGPRQRLNAPWETRMTNEYGRTPVSIMRTIQYVREQIALLCTVVVRLQEVMRAYNRFLTECNEGYNAYKTVRTVSEHIQPFLSRNQIILRSGAKKYGSYFCTLAKFDELSKPVTNIKSFSAGPEAMRELMDELQLFIVSSTDTILQGEWSIIEFIRHCPIIPWRLFSLFIDCPSFMKRGRANAKLCSTSPLEEWPLNPKTCPEDRLDRSPLSL